MIAGDGRVGRSFGGGALCLAKEESGDNARRSSSIFDIMSLMALLSARSAFFSTEFWSMIAAVLWRSAESSCSRREILSMRTTVG